MSASLSTLFIYRPVATTLLTLAITLAGLIAFRLLPVAPLPQVDFPTIMISATLPGASPETMAATVATPLERALGRIAGITEMTSTSSLGATQITVQFDLDRNIDGAANDVQAAINAARSMLPVDMPSYPAYRKVNPADAPIMVLTLTSQTMKKPQLYDAASTILTQKLAQISGIGQVTLGGSSLPAVRIELNPNLMSQNGIGFQDVRQAIVGANVNRPKGILESEGKCWHIIANDQADKADDYKPIIIAYHHDTPVRLSDIAEVVDSVEDLRNCGLANGQDAVLLVLRRQPGANIIETVERVHDALPQLRASIPAAIDLEIAMDRTPTIRSSLIEVERALLISVILVVLVVFLFLGNARATLIPSIVVPVSLVGTFGVMYLCNFSLNNLSLMALTIATGFVVDDAIVVLEAIERRLEEGMSSIKAAILGVRDVGFTVLSISLSLVAVFIPILLMGGIVGRLFREFAVTLSIAIIVSLVISLTTTPMLCARFLQHTLKPGRAGEACTRFFDRMLKGYAASLNMALNHKRTTMIILGITIGLNIVLYIIVPKGFFPQQDTGKIIGSIQADQASSFQSVQRKLAAFVDLVMNDPAVDKVVGFTGGGQRNTGTVYISLKPLDVRKASIDDVMGRLRRRFNTIAGASLFLQPIQDIRVGGRSSSALYQLTLMSDDLKQLRVWGPKLYFAMMGLPQLVDVNTDAQDQGLQNTLVIHRDTASKLGLTIEGIDASLNDAFGQRQISTIFNPVNQYHVVMEVAPSYGQSPEMLKQVFVSTSTGRGGKDSSAQVPLSAFAHDETTNAPLVVNHQGQFAAVTISFNLPQGIALGTASQAISTMMDTIKVPHTVHGTFQGTARAFQDSLASQPWLVLAALVTVYIVLGMLYESTIHPITILSTLPSAGIGALLGLMLCRTEFSIVALIGVILLIGIVKKNAIMMIDVAIGAQRHEGLNAHEAIVKACLLRFRPIMMTTMAAMMGAIPLAIGAGDGAEFRRPLGIAIVGGLVVSQLLTLYTTPVVYLYMERLRLWRHHQSS